MAPHSSTLAWKIPWMEEPGGLQSTGSLRRLSDFTFTFHFHALEKEMAPHSSVLAWRIPGTEEPGGLLSMGSHRVGYDWSDLAAAEYLKIMLKISPLYSECKYTRAECVHFVHRCKQNSTHRQAYTKYSKYVEWMNQWVNESVRVLRHLLLENRGRHRWKLCLNSFQMP